MPSIYAIFFASIHNHQTLAPQQPHRPLLRNQHSQINRPTCIHNRSAHTLASVPLWPLLGLPLRCHGDSRQKHRSSPQTTLPLHRCPRNPCLQHAGPRWYHHPWPIRIPLPEIRRRQLHPCPKSSQITQRFPTTPLLHFPPILSPWNCTHLRSHVPLLSSTASTRIHRSQPHALPPFQPMFRKQVSPQGIQLERNDKKQPTFSGYMNKTGIDIKNLADSSSFAASHFTHLNTLFASLNSLAFNSS